MPGSVASQFRWSNLLTYLAVSAATVGVAFTDGAATRFWGGLGMAIAVACDLFDGRFARRFKRTEDEQRIGVEIDSLADVISFGLVPAVCFVRIATTPDPLSRAMVLLAALFYLLCIVTRLAHFNVFQAGTGGFIGLPSNMPPLVYAFVLLWVPGTTVAATALVLGGIAAVGPFRIPRPNPPVLYTILAVSLMLAALHTLLLVTARSGP
jgi:CDP-diacylglycerol--serine O-phosphatidyltransferase